MVDFTPALRTEDVPAWDHETDVVVVGQGIAGCCAALEAARAGAEVLIVERASGGGGASALSSGIFYLGGGTPVQAFAGYADDPDQMYRFLMASCDPLNPAAVADYCADSAAHLDWLEQQGVPFERSYFPGKTVTTADTTCLAWTGNEKVWPFREVARPAPRGHKVAAVGASGGHEAMLHLLQRCTDAAIPAIYDSAVVALVQDGLGRVFGVRVKQAGTILHVRARRAVILACGSYNMARDILDEHLPLLSETSDPLGIPSNDGAGLRLGLSVGAAAAALDGLIPTASIYPPEQLVKGVIVNVRGERFVAEDAYHGRVGSFVMEQPGQAAYLIVDSETFSYPESKTAHHALVDGWETLEEMEASLKLPSGSLVRTLAEYNADAAAGEDRRFRKGAEWLKPLDQGPWAAFDLSFNKSSYRFITLGGIRTSADGEALDAYARAVPGLYAVGATAAHIPRSGKSYASGLSLGPGSYFGRRAGRHASGVAWHASALATLAASGTGGRR